MRPNRIDPNAYEAQARSLRRAFEDGMKRCEAELHEAVALADGEVQARAARVAGARDALRGARAAVDAIAALSVSLRGPFPPPPEQAPFDDAVARLEAVLEVLNPSRDA